MEPLSLINILFKIQKWCRNELLSGSYYRVALVVKNLPMLGDVRDTGSIPESRRYPGGSHGKPLQYSYLENPMDRGAWQATVYGVA